MADQAEHETVIRLTADIVDVEANRRWWRGGSNDYKCDSRRVDLIVDRHGTEHQPIWEDGRHEIVPGVEMYVKDRGHYLSIQRSACPVRVRFTEYSEYVSYEAHGSPRTSPLPLPLPPRRVPMSSARSATNRSSSMPSRRTG